MNKWFGHLKTVLLHKYWVFRYALIAGIPLRGLVHDLSKFSPTEFGESVRYYTGRRSPIHYARADQHYSLAWLHHKGRNKHHYEYWIDYDTDREHDPPLCGMKMPKRYVAEMALDRIAACQIYQGSAYDDSSPMQYYRKGRAFHLMHPETAELLETILVYLAEHGQRETFRYIRKTILADDYPY